MSNIQKSLAEHTVKLSFIDVFAHQISEDDIILGDYSASGLNLQLYNNNCLITNKNILASGGGSSVHEKCLVWNDQGLYIALSSYIMKINLQTGGIDWSVLGDDASCFGLHESIDQFHLIVHGELDISQFSYDGQLIWNCSGKDIFTGDVEITTSCITVTDFLGNIYEIDSETGENQIIGTGLPFPH